MNLAYNKAKVEQSTLRYWENVLKLIGCAGKYKAKISLRNNLRDESVSWKVRPVLAKYHGGSMKDLDRTIRNLQRNFNEIVERINAECARRELVQIMRPAELLELLQEKERRQFYDQKAKKYLSQNKVFPLQKLEDDFEKRSMKKKQQGQAKA